MDAQEETGKRRVLIVEDDDLISELMEDCLDEAGYACQSTSRGQDALRIVQETPPDIAILDLGLPDTDGLTLTTQLKAVAPFLGIVIVSGRSAPVERIVGLEVGADDYLCKPFEPRELVARIRSLLRRMETFRLSAEASSSARTPSASDSSHCYHFQGFTLDLDTVTLTSPDGSQPRLSSTEFTLLKTFAEHPNRVLSRDQLMDFIHTNDMPAFDRSIDVQITRLRKKIESDPKEPSLIKTIRNQGYIFASPVERG